MDIRQITDALIFGNLTNEELDKVIEGVKYARAKLSRATIRSITVGSHVKFTSSRTGRDITGQVIKIGRKNLVIREHGSSYGNWRVPANMVEVTE